MQKQAVAPHARRLNKTLRTRREVLSSVLAVTILSALPLPAGTLQSIHVVKGTGCECCEAWVRYLRSEGFTVTDEERYGTLLIRFKMDQGVPPAVYSCHTGTVGGYALEGHVPAADTRRLLDERPDAIGLAVRGMPYGSPGMGSENEGDAYEVLLIGRDGSTKIFSRKQPT